MLIEIHMIQNHSPSNLNRDDLGAPKTCIFGGVTRARISSQCLKRSIRNPGNPEDVHNRQPGLFAEAMASNMGTRTKFFPWLVQQGLRDSGIPSEEHPRIVLAARRIALSKEKEEKRPSATRRGDDRPATRQLIHLGPSHARDFVRKLSELRTKSEAHYKYFLDPIVGFQETVRELLADSGLDEKDRDKVVKSCWVIAKCRMSQLLKPEEGQEPEPEPELEDGQPGLAHASLVAERLSRMRTEAEKQFRDLTKPQSIDEKTKLKEEAPEKPSGGMDDFMGALKAAQRCDAVDIALFGRMTTSDAFEDVEAAMQVAHAISTHAVVNEVDYFTAVDDLGRGAGAGHVDEAMFNSACFYKYFSVDWDQLVDNLAGPTPKDPGEKAKKEERETYRNARAKYSEARKSAQKLAAATLGHFIRAAAVTTPTGKQNSFAANNEPAGILVEIKKNGKMPLSYANAFAEPARKIGDPPDDAPDCVSLVGRSIAQLGDHVCSARRAYGLASTLLWYSPKLWRYPLQAWEREPDGSKKKENGKEKPPKTITDKCFDVLGGEAEAPAGLVEAVIAELQLGFGWSEAKSVGKAQSTEA